MQQDTLLLCPNVVVNITNEMARKRKIFNFGMLKRLVLPLNVGKENGQTFIRTMNKSLGSCGCWDSTIQTNPLLWQVSLETPIRYYRCGQQLYQPHSSHWKVWWYAPLLGSPPHGYVSVRPYVWLEMPQLSATDMLWHMWKHCSNTPSAGGFRPTPISVLDWSQREKSSLSTTSKPTCLFSKENHNVLVCRKSHWNQLCASASWLAR